MGGSASSRFQQEDGSGATGDIFEILANSTICQKAPVTTDPDRLVSYEGPGPWFTCAPDGEMPPRVANAGLASAKEMPPLTLMQLFDKVIQTKGDHEALKAERPVPQLGENPRVPPPLPRDEWKTWTFKEYHADVRSAAKGFVDLGFQRFESINIWGFNSPEWHISALAANFAGGKTAGLYPTDTAENAAYKVVHSQGSIVVLDDRSKMERLAKALGERKDCHRLKAFVAWGFETSEGEKVTVPGLHPIPVLGWDALIEMGKASRSDAEVERRVAATRPGHCHALIYTSGTTGEPKAVMVSHDNTIFDAATLSKVLEASCGFGKGGGEERMLSYLPLSHIAGMMLDIVNPLQSTANLDCWVTTFFARPYDLKEKALRDRLSVAKPTLFLGVPLVWERIADQIRALGAQASFVQSQVAGVAKGMALDLATRSQIGGDGSVPWGYSLADKVVLSKIKARLGLDECKSCLTAAAPIRKDTLAFFGSLGIAINEVYGMSECAGACTISTDQAHQWGSCGWDLPGFHIKSFQVDAADLNKKTECPRAPLIDASDETYQGELCYRGRCIMMGYMACPDFGPAHLAEMQKKTAETIDSEGWLHSGDKGLITEQGMIKITGRYKELIIGAGGENIAPVPIEDAVKKTCDGIAECVMIGDKRNYNVALITLKAAGANGEVPGTDQLDAGAKKVNPDVKTITEAMDDQVWIEAVQAAVKNANENGQVCPNNAYKIQKFTILQSNFSEEGNELTPTKKLKRKVVETKYADIIDQVYATEGTYIKCER